jgi:hypothetical protein
MLAWSNPYTEGIERTAVTLPLDLVWLAIENEVRLGKAGAAVIAIELLAEP